MAVILIVAFALALDAFAVSLVAGATAADVGLRRTLRLAWHFGFFQSLMAFTGWIVGRTIAPWIAPFDHWVAFVLLLLVGGRMLLESSRGEDADAPTKDITRGKSLIVLSIATSIDALGVGLSLFLLPGSPWLAVLIIGVVAFALTAVGMQLSHSVAKLIGLGRWAEAVGGLVLIGIGLHILHEHGVF
ncbi:MAG: manganese efflux pump MntP family protein [Candidatus Lernaella stagnicola]|nr:manganese efflux pump MntP family protein [Candidatus Lernaella stagnicola]